MIQNPLQMMTTFALACYISDVLLLYPTADFALNWVSSDSLNSSNISATPFYTTLRINLNSLNRRSKISYSTACCVLFTKSNLTYQWPLHNSLITWSLPTGILPMQLPIQRPVIDLRNYLLKIESQSSNFCGKGKNLVKLYLVLKQQC